MQLFDPVSIAGNSGEWNEPKINKIPSFVWKLFNLLEDPCNHPYIAWKPCGRVFAFRLTPEFCEEVLKKNYRQSQGASFIRQLNLYGFRKPARLAKHDKTPTTDLVFMHPRFQRARPDLLVHIARVLPHVSSDLAPPPTPPHDTLLDQIARLESQAATFAHQLAVHEQWLACMLLYLGIPQGRMHTHTLAPSS